MGPVSIDRFERKWAEARLRLDNLRRLNEFDAETNAARGEGIGILRSGGDDAASAALTRNSEFAVGNVLQDPDIQARTIDIGGSSIAPSNLNRPLKRLNE